MNYKVKATLFVLLCSASFIFCGPAPVGDAKFHSLDTIHIGDQVWMKHNTSINLPNSFWYERDSLNNHHNGRLYFFSAALNSCPKGFHIPTDEEWQVLIDRFGGNDQAGKALMEGGASGLNLPLPGYRSGNSSNDLFGKKGEQGFYWSSTVKGDQTAFARMFSANSSVITDIYYRRANAFSVRLIMDTPALK
ncbi:MAG: hypothetical protein IPO63_16785 [Bacteroidetes bacterium]|nr:hypothetical protein [Bacteroidota bacterium]